MLGEDLNSLKISQNNQTHSNFLKENFSQPKINENYDLNPNIPTQDQNLNKRKNNNTNNNSNSINPKSTSQANSNTGKNNQQTPDKKDDLSTKLNMLNRKRTWNTTHTPVKMSRFGKKVYNSVCQFSSQISKETGATLPTNTGTLIDPTEETEHLENENEEFNPYISPIPKPVFITIGVSCVLKKEPLTIKAIRLYIDGAIFPLEVIKTSIDEFNSKLETEKEMQRFSLNYQNYKLKPSKKDGRPKSDYPAIDFETCIKDIQIENFALIYKEKELLTIKKKLKCEGCLLF